MELEDYIKTHPEQFKDDIDKWLFLEFGIIGGCCSAEKSHEYHIARMVAEKFNNAFMDKACGWLKESITNNPECNRIISKKGVITMGELIKDFKNYMKGE